MGQNSGFYGRHAVCLWGVSGFFDTGDVGFLKDDNLYLEGRSDDVINIHKVYKTGKTFKKRKF